MMENVYTHVLSKILKGLKQNIMKEYQGFEV